MSYFLLDGDMYGGDVSRVDTGSLEQGIKLAKDYIYGDSQKCATIAEFSTGNFTVFFKNWHQTNPSKSS